MDQKDYLGLSLSLFPPSSSSSSCNLKTFPWQPPHHLLFPPVAAGIDVNQTPPAAARNAEEDGAATPSSPNSREISSSSAKRASGGGGGSDEDDDGDGDGGRKKLRLSKDQTAVLEESFKEHRTLNPKQKVALAKQLRLRPRQVEVWFQNRRARTKLKQTEVDCELLRRCCQELTEENRRLQKEVQELRALKLSPQLCMHMTPPTTLTLCPSCERVSSSKNPPPPPAEQHHHHHHHHQQQFLLHHGGARHQLRPVTAPSWPLRPSFLDAPPQRS